MVGRNASCPCGSGKKYKRCCAGKNEEYLGEQVEKELNSILIGVFEEASKQIKFEEFDSYAKSWKTELGGHWDMKSIEEAISAYYIFVARRDLWVNYLSTTLNRTLRLTVREVVEAWKKPIVLLGKVISEGDEFLEIKELFGDNTYLLKKNMNMISSVNAVVFGLALPDNQTHDNGIRIISSLMIVKDITEDLKNAIEVFVKSNSFEQNPNFLEEHMLDIYAILLGKPVVASEAAATTETVVASDVIAKVDIAAALETTITVDTIAASETTATIDTTDVPEIIEELTGNELTPIQQETIVLLRGVLAERGENLEKQELLENVCISYFAKEQPKFRKGNVVAAGVFRAALDLDLLNEEPMTNSAVAKIFDISQGSMSKHAEAVRELISQL